MEKYLLRREFWVIFFVMFVCNSLQIQKLRILDNFTPPKKTLILVQLIGINKVSKICGFLFYWRARFAVFR